MKSYHSRVCAGGLVAAALLACAGSAQGQTSWLCPDSGDWSVAGNWSAGAPTATTDAIVNCTAHSRVSVDPAIAAVRRLEIASAPGTQGAVSLDQVPAVLRAVEAIIGGQGVGALVIGPGSTVDFQTVGRPVFVGASPGGSGRIEINGGVLTTNSARLEVGHQGTGAVHIRGDGLLDQPEILLAAFAGSAGEIVLGDLASRGRVQSFRVRLGQGASVIRFRPAEPLFLFDPEITIGTSTPAVESEITHEGSGTTAWLTDSNLGMVPVSVLAGHLTVQSRILGGGSEIVHSGAVLSGQGEMRNVVLRDGARLVPGNPLSSAGRMIASSLAWEGGATIAIKLGAGATSSSRLDLIGALEKGGGPGGFQFEFFDDPLSVPQLGLPYEVIRFGSRAASFLPEDFSFSYSGSLGAVAGRFEFTANALTFTMSEPAPPDPNVFSSGFEASAP